MGAVAKTPDAPAAAIAPAHRELADLAAALASPTRVAIVDYLTRGECCACKEVTAEIGFSQPTISRHLAVLEAAGLVRATKTGTTKRYGLVRERWEDLRAAVEGFCACAKTGA